MSAPSKSDLQQGDIVHVRDATLRAQMAALVPDNPWVATAPVFLVFCGNNRRHRLLFEWRGRPFVNDHLDAFFNAAVDSGIVLATFVAAGLSAIVVAVLVSPALRNVIESLGRSLGDALGL